MTTPTDPRDASAAEINKAIAEAIGWKSDGTKVFPPNWAGDMTTAMGLLGHLEETHRPFTLTDVYDGRNRVGYRASLLMDGAAGKIDVDADTAPLAICRAFLAARRGA